MVFLFKLSCRARRLFLVLSGRFVEEGLCINYQEGKSILKFRKIVWEGEIMHLISDRGFIVSITLYVLLFFFFSFFFGNTPVNLLGLDNGNGISNLFINLISYGFTVILISLIPSLFIRKKKKWLRGNLIGTVVAILLSLIIVPLYLIIF